MQGIKGVNNAMIDVASDSSQFTNNHTRMIKSCSSIYLQLNINTGSTISDARTWSIILR